MISFRTNVIDRSEICAKKLNRNASASHAGTAFLQLAAEKDLIEVVKIKPKFFRYQNCFAD